MARPKMTKTRYPNVYRLTDGRFFVRVSVRVPDRSPVQRTDTLDEGSTVEDAVRRATAMREHAQDEARRLAAGETIPSPRLRATGHAPSETVEDYARRWYELKKRRASKPSTLKRYRTVLDDKILPRLGHLPVAAVCKSAVESWVAWAEAQRKPNGEPYSRATLDGWFRPLVTMLKDLAADYRIPDPTDRVRPPYSEVESVREHRTLTEEQFASFLAAVRCHTPNRYAEMMAIALTGMRPGELFALKWDAVDLDRGCLVLRRGVSAGKLTESTKTKAQREVPLHPILVEVLKRHRRRLVKEQRRGLDTGLIFPSDTGTVRTASSLQKAYELAARTAKLDIRVGNQVLRRTMNTLMRRAQVDRITLRAIMGHASEKMTELYSGVDLEEKKAALATVFGDFTEPDAGEEEAVEADEQSDTLSVDPEPL